MNCSCSDYNCRIYGCKAARQNPPHTWQPVYSSPIPPTFYPDQTQPLRPLSEDDVRRIIREELARHDAQKDPQ